ncbi:non-hydrolyzing UDP-N-acetylglucosamine 2-epimerase [Cupriavidus ulmosensis]|uniref:non-hydrolyzing UDP-N-acetylglucosamine 2-epimerase n=1 Tax=Cupriavidus ulmosensis TaxID=3065913 RepID=UPI00296AF977|nr:UDP-N-acetylglucosamine 2-epimerase (non-hydrolyzing) [Cupriavidus sp. CV2]
MKVLTIIGARPQFIKAAAVSRAFRRSALFSEVIVHTGQHFDSNMSDIFFDELEIPHPDYNLGIGGGSHGQNTGRMIEAIEKVMVEERPDWILVYGDTDSTLAGAIAAVKLHIPLVHVEAGLRSFNNRMPEETNRKLTDHVSTLLLVPNVVALGNLDAEGIRGAHVMNVGDVMYDAALIFSAKAERESRVLDDLGLAPKQYILATVHRQENTDVRERLESILRAFAAACQPVVLPLHPRTRQRVAQMGLSIPGNVKVVDPVGYLDMVMLEKNASLIATDSGGVQKEAYFHQVPCITLRDETEWVELVELGWNRLASPASEGFKAVFSSIPAAGRLDAMPYGDGHAAELIAKVIAEHNR